ncbi:outer membrane protein [Vibrio neonatus]|uniref:outer membrane protein n=1 Tax=Vibrio neonatus TaxID=278860 RepID=UPI0021C2A509|nr:porin family protein [Vibrio neonatus]
MKKYNLVALCGIALLSSSAFASSDPSGFYVLGAVGTTGIDDGGYIDDLNDQKNLQDPTFDSEFKTKGSTKTYSMGYQINRIVGVEATYMDYGRINLSTNDHSIGSEQVFAPESFSVSANLGYSFHNGLRPFAKIGISYIDFHSSETDQPPFKNINEHGGIHIGAGVEYALDLGENHGNVLFRTGVEGDIASMETTDNSGPLIEEDYDWSIATLYAGVGYRF